MTTTAKQNGTSKKENANTTQKAVVKKLAQEATTTKPAEKTTQETPKKEAVTLSLDQRINQFEKLRGLANQRERLANTLTELARFNYNQGESSTFSLKDATGLEFKTTNTNLIKMVTGQLQQTLETRKNELESEILEFKL